MSRMRANPIVHMELHTGNLAAACAFYGQLCGWRAQRVDDDSGSYLALELGGAIGGGAVECETRRPIWLPYVQVGEVAGTTERARGVGAAVLVEPREGPAGRRRGIAAPGGGRPAVLAAEYYALHPH